MREVGIRGLGWNDESRMEGLVPNLNATDPLIKSIDTRIYVFTKHIPPISRSVSMCILVIQSLSLNL